jgi:hypothetical protein
MEELKHLAVLWTVYNNNDDLESFLNATVRARFVDDKTRINPDAIFETSMGPLFVEYDGWFYHKDVLHKDVTKTEILTKFGRVIRIRDNLPPIELPYCQNIIVDSVKDKDIAYRKTYDAIGGPDKNWQQVWARANSLYQRAFEFLMDNTVNTMDDWLNSSADSGGDSSSSVP